MPRLKKTTSSKKKTTKSRPSSSSSKSGNTRSQSMSSSRTSRPQYESSSYGNDRYEQNNDCVRNVDRDTQGYGRDFGNRENVRDNPEQGREDYRNYRYDQGQSNDYERDSSMTRGRDRDQDYGRPQNEDLGLSRFSGHLMKGGLNGDYGKWKAVKEDQKKFYG